MVGGVQQEIVVSWDLDADTLVQRETHTHTERENESLISGERQLAIGNWLCCDEEILWRSARDCGFMGNGPSDTLVIFSVSFCHTLAFMLVMWRGLVVFYTADTIKKIRGFCVYDVFGL